MPIDYLKKRFHEFGITSSIAESNFVKLIQLMENHNLLDKFCDVSLDLSLAKLNLCKHLKHFGRVWVYVNSVESVDNLNLLFNHCKYCYHVGLRNCKLIENLKLDLLMKQLKYDDTRMEELQIRKCHFDEINLSMMIEIIVNIKTVDMWDNSVKQDHSARSFAQNSAILYIDI